MMHFKSCIRCLRVGIEEDDGETAAIFLESTPLFPFLVEEVSEDDELRRWTGGAD